MKRRSCGSCGKPADRSLVLLVSTLGRADRQQACSRAASLCTECLQGLMTLNGSNLQRLLGDALTEAATVLAVKCESYPDQQSSTTEADE